MKFLQSMDSKDAGKVRRDTLRKTNPLANNTQSQKSKGEQT